MFVPLFENSWFSVGANLAITQNLYGCRVYALLSFLSKSSAGRRRPPPPTEKPFTTLGMQSQTHCSRKCETQAFAIGVAPTMPRNCRSARRMEGRISGLRHRRRGGPARVAADRFEGPECGKKGAQAGRGTAVRSLAEDMAVSVNTSANTCSLENVWCRRTLFEPKPPLPSGLRGEKWLMGETGGQSMG